MKLAVTGHRPERLKGQEKMIKEWAVEQLIRLQPSVIYDGMAQGNRRKRIRNTYYLLLRFS